MNGNGANLNLPSFADPHSEGKLKEISSAFHQSLKQRWFEIPLFCKNSINPPPFTENITFTDGFISTSQSEDKTCQLKRAWRCSEIHVILSLLSLFQ